MKTFTKLAVVTAAAMGFAVPCAHATQGDFLVYNNSSAFIAPYFKFHCPDTGWIFFGGIAPNSQFAWNGLTPDGCVIEFTTPFPEAPPGSWQAITAPVSRSRPMRSTSS
jgi:hypothetical protein